MTGKYYKEQIKKMLVSQILTKEDFISFVDLINSKLFPTEIKDGKTVLRKLTKEEKDAVQDYLMAVECEMIPLLSIPDNLCEIVKPLKNGMLGEKKEKIINTYNFKVFYSAYNMNGYKDKANLEDEISRILEDVDPDEVLSRYLESIGVTDIISEFLTVNYELAKMFKSDNFGVYSALVNYSYLDNQRVKFYKMYEKRAPSEENWEEISNLLKRFLKEIDARTIHY